MRFVFVDETGDPGSDIENGSSPFFGMAALSIKSQDYSALRSLLSQVHWLCGTASQIELNGHYVRSAQILRGLNSLAENSVISASGIYLIKKEYGGHYLTWSEQQTDKKEWRYYLRNYLLRHLLEYHFSQCDDYVDHLDLVLDRVLLSEAQRQNTTNYLNSKTLIALKEPFKIPPISFLTIADSEYVGGLEIAHVLADVVRDSVKAELNKNIEPIVGFIRKLRFTGSTRT
jgi:hypothetical protein